ncbi:MAG TPA: hypothetical protein DEO54_09525 [Rikenellaceae bacterium]|nr:MAG: hypothetical protein A2X20_08840 [Bacteroidetes bacterium GWE2_40_15]HBZ26453.1 hypothetical protein [Rikenellaceae bacterium]
MSKFKIAHWDDDPIIIMRLKSVCHDLNSRYGNIEYTDINFTSVLIETDEIINNYNLLIIDLLDENNSKKLIGFDILEKFKNEKITFPIIVYTTAKREKGSDIDINTYEEKYPEVVFIKKSEDADTSRIKREVEKIIKENLQDQFEVTSDYINEFSQQLRFFGRDKLNQILFEVKKHFELPIDEKLNLSKLKSGFSGAILFKFSVENTGYVLKISNEVDVLESEFDKSKSYYHLLPTKLFNWLDGQKFYTPSKQTVAIVIKLVPNSKTLFDYIINAKGKDNVEKVLNSFFFVSGMQKHYKSQRAVPIKWASIFEKFKNDRFLTIKEVYRELESLLKNFDLKKVEELILNEDFGKLNSKTLTKLGGVTLNHLDLHSKNILIEDDETPILIDTGGLGYGYWCLDVSRLLVDLFINGFGYNKVGGHTREFFDVNSFDNYFAIGQKIVSLEQLDYDSKNDRLIDSINWLTSNVASIYEDDFSLWEFQLGLMKELLQVSYRTGSVPHSKRALALELAYFCMNEAEKNAS